MSLFHTSDPDRWANRQACVISNELFCKAGREEERLNWSAGAGGLERRRLDKASSSFFVLLSVMCFPMCWVLFCFFVSLFFVSHPLFSGFVSSFAASCAPLFCVSVSLWFISSVFFLFVYIPWKTLGSLCISPPISGPSLAFMKPKNV